MIDLSKEDVYYLNSHGVTISDNQVVFKQAFSSKELTLNFSTVKEVSFRKSIIPFWIKLLSIVSTIFAHNRYSDRYFQNDISDYQYSYDMVFVLRDTNRVHTKLDNIDVFRLKRIIAIINSQLG